MVAQSQPSILWFVKILILELQMSDTPKEPKKPNFFDFYEDWEKGVDTLVTKVTAIGKVDGQPDIEFQAESLEEMDAIMRAEGYQRPFMGKVYWPIRAPAVK